MATLLCKVIDLASQPLFCGGKNCWVLVSLWEVAGDYGEMGSGFKSKTDSKSTTLAVIYCFQFVFVPFFVYK